MNVKEITEKISKFIKDKKEAFKVLKKEKKIAIIVGVVAVILAIVFGVKYVNDNKYQLLFSNLDTTDAAAITAELESKSVDMKIEGNSIYVPKEQVDKLRLELSSSITNGSKGFELMDESSSFGLTDEEFAIKKQRMIQGEIEKSIKSFSQVEDAKVLITQGEESVFAQESTPGSAAVSIKLKTGKSLESSQIRSIMSLVSASSSNIPAQNVEVVDQNMNLLSEGLFDENGNAISTNSSGIDIARNAEKELNSDLEKSITDLLESIYGKGKVKASVNTDLNFDSEETTKIVVDQDSVVINESRSENTSTESSSTGGAIDNNMNNVEDDDSSSTVGSKEESIEYETGKTETKIIKAQGELNKITASVAIDGSLTATQIRDVTEMVSNAIGIDDQRGDSIKVIATQFSTAEEVAEEDNSEVNNLKMIGYIALAVMLLGIIALIIVLVLKKKKAGKEEEYEDNYEIDLINQKLEEMDKSAYGEDGDDEENVSLEDEVRKYAADNPDKVTDLINSWLNI